MTPEARIAELEAENTVVYQTLDTVNARLGKIAEGLEETGDRVIGIRRHLERKAVAQQSALDAVVDRIIKALFTNGQGEEANRLVLAKDIDKGFVDLGGWGRPAVKDIILKVLA